MTPDTLFAALSDLTRLRAVMLMHTCGELCVCELTSALEEPQPKVSRHLAVLREAGLVRNRREGKWMHYRLNPALPDWAESIIDQACRQMKGDPRFIPHEQKLSFPADTGRIVCD